MSDDLIKRVCQSWVDAGLGDETFWENWPNCPTDDTLTANQVLARIEELERDLAKAVECLQWIMNHRGECFIPEPWDDMAKDLLAELEV
jgi:hypothetical protein